MVKVLDPEGIIIGVFESKADVPKRLPNRMCSHFYRRSECDIVEVTDPEDYRRLLPSLQKVED
jgi:hypothetical protein